MPVVRLSLLVTHVDGPDALPDAGLLRQQHRATHDEEEIVGPFLAQGFRQNLRAGQQGHGGLLVECDLWK
jgi:hypothetical protein